MCLHLVGLYLIFHLVDDCFDGLICNWVKLLADVLYAYLVEHFSNQEFWFLILLLLLLLWLLCRRLLLSGRLLLNVLELLWEWLHLFLLELFWNFRRVLLLCIVVSICQGRLWCLLRLTQIVVLTLLSLWLSWLQMLRLIISLRRIWRLNIFLLLDRDQRRKLLLLFEVHCSKYCIWKIDYFTVRNLLLKSNFSKSNFLKSNFSKSKKLWRNC